MALGKNINPQYYNEWAKRRIAALCNTAGSSELIAILTPENLPKASTMARLANILNSSHSVRKELFLSIACLARDRQKNMYGRLYDELIQCLQFTEMRHIITIEKYIFKQYPELAKTSLLAGLPIAFATALTYIDTFKEDDKPFIKLLKDKNETASMNRSNFKKALIVAKTIASKDQDSYRNYGEEEMGESALIIKAATLKYIEQREKAAFIGAVEESETRPVEGQMLLDHFVEEFKTKSKITDSAPTTILQQAKIII